MSAFKKVLPHADGFATLEAFDGDSLTTSDKSALAEFITYKKDLWKLHQMKNPALKLKPRTKPIRQSKRKQQGQTSLPLPALA